MKKFLTRRKKCRGQRVSRTEKVPREQVTRIIQEKTAYEARVGDTYICRSRRPRHSWADNWPDKSVTGRTNELSQYGITLHLLPVTLWKKGSALFARPFSMSCHNARIRRIAPRVNASRCVRTAGSRPRAKIPTTKRISIVRRNGGVLVTQIIGARIELSTPNIPRRTVRYRPHEMPNGTKNLDCKERT